MVLVDDNTTITAVQVFPELVVYFDWWGCLMFKLGKSIYKFDGGEEEHVPVVR